MNLRRERHSQQTGRARWLDSIVDVLTESKLTENLDYYMLIWSRSNRCTSTTASRCPRCPPCRWGTRPRHGPDRRRRPRPRPHPRRHRRRQRRRQRSTTTTQGCGGRTARGQPRSSSASALKDLEKKYKARWRKGRSGGFAQNVLRYQKMMSWMPDKDAADTLHQKFLEHHGVQGGTPSQQETVAGWSRLPKYLDVVLLPTRAGHQSRSAEMKTRKRVQMEKKQAADVAAAMTTCR